MPAAASARDSAFPDPDLLPEHCPLREPQAMQAFRAAIRAGSDLSLRTQAFLAPSGPEGAGAWIRSMLAQSQALFQPWTLETLFLVGVLGEARFSVLERGLGASSRTLSARLALLVRDGFVERRVEAGPPLRTSYRLTKRGRATVAAGSPLLAHLNAAAAMDGRLAVAVRTRRMRPA